MSRGQGTMTDSGTLRPTNRLPIAGVEVEPSSVGEREARKFYEENVRTRVTNKRGGSVGPTQFDDPQVDAILHEGG